MGFGDYIAGLLGQIQQGTNQLATGGLGALSGNPVAQYAQPFIQRLAQNFQANVAGQVGPLQASDLPLPLQLPMHALAPGVNTAGLLWEAGNAIGKGLVGTAEGATLGGGQRLGEALGIANSNPAQQSPTEQAADQAWQALIHGQPLGAFNAIQGGFDQAAQSPDQATARVANVGRLANELGAQFGNPVNYAEMPLEAGGALLANAPDGLPLAQAALARGLEGWGELSHAAQFPYELGFSALGNLGRAADNTFAGGAGQRFVASQAERLGQALQQIRQQVAGLPQDVAPAAEALAPAAADTTPLAAAPAPPVSPEETLANILASPLPGVAEGPVLYHGSPRQFNPEDIQAIKGGMYGPDKVSATIYPDRSLEYAQQYGTPGYIYRYLPGYQNAIDVSELPPSLAGVGGQRLTDALANLRDAQGNPYDAIVDQARGNAFTAPQNLIPLSGQPASDVLAAQAAQNGAHYLFPLEVTPGPGATGGTLADAIAATRQFAQEHGPTLEGLGGLFGLDARVAGTGIGSFEGQPNANLLIHLAAGSPDMTPEAVSDAARAYAAFVSGAGKQDALALMRPIDNASQVAPGAGYYAAIDLDLAHPLTPEEAQALAGQLPEGFDYTNVAPTLLRFADFNGSGLNEALPGIIESVNNTGNQVVGALPHLLEGHYEASQAYDALASRGLGATTGAVSPQARAAYQALLERGGGQSGAAGLHAGLADLFAQHVAGLGPTGAGAGAAAAPLAGVVPSDVPTIAAAASAAAPLFDKGLTRQLTKAGIDPARVAGSDPDVVRAALQMTSSPGYFYDLLPKLGGTVLPALGGPLALAAPYAGGKVGGAIGGLLPAGSDEERQRHEQLGQELGTGVGSVIGLLPLVAALRTGHLEGSPVREVAPEAATLLEQVARRGLNAGAIRDAARQNLAALGYSDFARQGWQRILSGDLSVDDVLGSAFVTRLSQQRSTARPELAKFAAKYPDLADRMRAEARVADAGTGKLKPNWTTKREQPPAQGKIRLEDVAAYLLQHTPEGQALASAIKSGDPAAIDTAVHGFKAIWPSYINSGDVDAFKRWHAEIPALRDYIVQRANEGANGGQIADDIINQHLLFGVRDTKAGFLMTHLGGGEGAVTPDTNVQDILAPQSRDVSVGQYRQFLRDLFPAQDFPAVDGDDAMRHHLFWDALLGTQTNHAGIQGLMDYTRQAGELGLRPVLAGHVANPDEAASGTIRKVFLPEGAAKTALTQQQQGRLAALMGFLKARQPDDEALLEGAARQAYQRVNPTGKGFPQFWQAIQDRLPDLETLSLGFGDMTPAQIGKIADSGGVVNGFQLHGAQPGQPLPLSLLRAKAAAIGMTPGSQRLQEALDFAAQRGITGEEAAKNAYAQHFLETEARSFGLLGAGNPLADQHVLNPVYAALTEANPQLMQMGGSFHLLYDPERTPFIPTYHHPFALASDAVLPMHEDTIGNFKQYFGPEASTQPFGRPATQPFGPHGESVSGSPLLAHPDAAPTVRASSLVLSAPKDLLRRAASDPERAAVELLRGTPPRNRGYSQAAADRINAARKPGQAGVQPSQVYDLAAVPSAKRAEAMILNPSTDNLAGIVVRAQTAEGQQQYLEAAQAFRAKVGRPDLPIFVTHGPEGAPARGVRELQPDGTLGPLTDLNAGRTALRRDVARYNLADYGQAPIRFVAGLGLGAAGGAATGYAAGDRDQRALLRDAALGAGVGGLGGAALEAPGNRAVLEHAAALERQAFQTGETNLVPKAGQRVAYMRNFKTASPLVVPRNLLGAMGNVGLAGGSIGQYLRDLAEMHGNLPTLLPALRAARTTADQEQALMQALPARYRADYSPGLLKKVIDQAGVAYDRNPVDLGAANVHPVVGAVRGAVLGNLSPERAVLGPAGAGLSALEGFLNPAMTGIKAAATTVIDQPARMVLAMPDAGDLIEQAAPDFLHAVQRLGGDVRQLDPLGRFDPEDLYAPGPRGGQPTMLTGLKPADAERLAATWGHIQDVAAAAGGQAATSAMGDFSHNAGGFLNAVFPGGIWNKEQLQVLARAAARHPAAALGAVALAHQQYQDALASGDPTKAGQWRLTDQTPGIGMLARLANGGAPGNLYVNPLYPFSPVSASLFDVGRELDPNLNALTPGYDRIRQVAGLLGLADNPAVDTAAYMLHASNETPTSPDRLAALGQYLDAKLYAARDDPLAANWQHALGNMEVPNFVGAMLAPVGNEPDTLLQMASGHYLDPAIARAADELVFRQTGQPLDAPQNAGLLPQLLDHTSPLYRAALEQGLGGKAVGAALNYVSPMPGSARTEVADLEHRLQFGLMQGLYQQLFGGAPGGPLTRDELATLAQSPGGPALRAGIQQVLDRAQLAHPILRVGDLPDAQAIGGRLLNEWERQHVGLQAIPPAYNLERAMLAEQLGLTQPGTLAAQQHQFDLLQSGLTYGPPQLLPGVPFQADPYAARRIQDYIQQELNAR